METQENSGGLRPGFASVLNLLAFYDFADEETRGEAFASYPRYHRIMREVSERLGFSVSVGAAVFSALSPNNDYIGNLRDARRLLEAARAGRSIESFKVSTYGHNKRKAWDIAHGMDPLEAIVAPKTRNFYLNISNPEDPHPVTVDGHIFWALHGKRGRVTASYRNGVVDPKQREKAASVGPHNYDGIADAVREVAKLRGVLGNQAQAVIWHSYRIRFNITRAKQRELFPSDCLAAQIPIF